MRWFILLYYFVIKNQQNAPARGRGGGLIDGDFGGAVVPEIEELVVPGLNRRTVEAIGVDETAVVGWHGLGGVILAQLHDLIIEMRGDAPREIGGVETEIFEPPQALSILDSGTQDVFAVSAATVLR